MNPFTRIDAAANCSSNYARPIPPPRNKVIRHQQMPPKPRSFRRRSYPARTKSFDEDNTRKNTSDTVASSTIGSPDDRGRDRKQPKTKAHTSDSPFKRLRRSRRRSSIASESSSYFSSERKSNATVTEASFDARGDALHKHYHYGNPAVSVVVTDTTANYADDEHKQQQRAAAEAAAAAARRWAHPQKETMKRHRRDKTATLGMVGAGVGTLVLPVVGTIVGGVLTGYAANQSLKRYEKKIQRKWEREQFQRDASASQTARHAVFV